MKRRQLIALIGSAAVWPLTTRAQLSTAPEVGFLHGGTAASIGSAISEFHAGLNEAGFLNDRNVNIKFQWAEGDYRRLLPMAEALVVRRVAVIVAATTAATKVAKEVTTNIPIIFVSDGGPVRSGLVKSLSRPGRNLTGTFIHTRALAVKQLKILHQIVPNTKPIGLLVKSMASDFENHIGGIRTAARSLGKKIVVLPANSERDIETAFAEIVQRGLGALLVASGSFLFERREQIVGLANHYKVPLICQSRGFVSSGGLLSYGSDLNETYHTLGIYAGRILNGEKPSDLPILQSAKVEFVINLKTAKALGITIPIALLGLADGLVE